MRNAKNKRYLLLVSLFSLCAMMVVSTTLQPSYNVQTVGNNEDDQQIHQLEERISSSAGSTVYEQDFDEQTDEEVPNGWVINDAPASFCKFRVSETANYDTPFLVVNDAQNGIMTWGRCTLASKVLNGNFSFDLGVWDTNDFLNTYYIILENDTGDAVITMQFDHDVPTTKFDMMIQDETIAGLNAEIVGTKQVIHRMDVVFNRGLIDFYINGSIEVSDLVYDASEISRIYIRSELSGYRGGLHLDNLILTRIRLDQPEFELMNTADIDGSFTINWTTCASATNYKLYRDTKPIDSINDLIPIYDGGNLQYAQSGLSQGHYYYALIAENATDTSQMSDEFSIYVSPDIVYHQDFNDQTDEEIPDGWTISDAPASFCKFRVSEVSYYDTPYMLINDAQSGFMTTGRHTLDSSVLNGNFSFDIAVWDTDDFLNTYYIILENDTGDAVITMQFDHDVPTTKFDMTVEGTTISGLAAEIYTKRLVIQQMDLVFNNSLIDLYINGSQQISDLTYQASEISKIYIRSELTGLRGGLHLDNMILENFTTTVSEEYPTGQPVMNSISSPDLDGSYTVSWNSVQYADTYYLFRSGSDFVDVTGLSPIYTGSSLSYDETDRPSDSSWYYAVIASNGQVNSTLADTVGVNIEYPTEKAVMDAFDSPDSDGSYEVNWSSVQYADTYYLFRSDADFTGVAGLSPIYTGSDLGYLETGRPEGEWFYAVIASNGEVNATLSDTVSVIVAYPGDAPIINDIKSPNYNGTYEVSWNDDGSATSYRLYCETEDFTSIVGLTPIYEGTDPYYNEIEKAPGQYYYAVIGITGGVQTPLSAREFVEVKNYNGSIIALENKFQTATIYDTSGNVLMRMNIDAEDDLQIRVTVYDVNPTGTSLTNAVRYYRFEAVNDGTLVGSPVLYMYYDDSGLNEAEEQSMEVYKHTGSDWENLGGVSYPDENHVLKSVGNFGLYAAVHGTEGGMPPLGGIPGYNIWYIIVSAICAVVFIKTTRKRRKINIK